MICFVICRKISNCLCRNISNTQKCFANSLWNWFQQNMATTLESINVSKLISTDQKGHLSWNVQQSNPVDVPPGPYCLWSSLGIKSCITLALFAGFPLQSTIRWIVSTNCKDGTKILKILKFSHHWCWSVSDPEILKQLKNFLFWGLLLQCDVNI